MQVVLLFLIWWCKWRARRNSRQARYHANRMNAYLRNYNIPMFGTEKVVKRRMKAMWWFRQARLLEIE